MKYYFWRRHSWIAAVPLSLVACSGDRKPHTPGEQDSGRVNTPDSADASAQLPTDSTDLDDPAEDAGEREESYPLLGSAHGGHLWNKYCEGKADDEALPVDPRTLVQPGINEGKAAYYNAYWIDCHVGAKADDAAPAT